ncbi:MAG: hypothetical protein HQL40_08615 [Alphaproteobacteria bacterium]|nr:hypothetical protein [Alphaproteobacteria bacterium]
MTKSKLPKKKKAKLSAEERKKENIKNAHMRSVRATLRNMGFNRAEELAGAEIRIKGQAGEFDDAFVYENVILLLEYTTSQSSDVTGHLKKKKIIFSNALTNATETIDYLRRNFLAFDARLGSHFHPDKYILKIVYCSLNSYDESVKQIVDEPIYFDYQVLKYFEKVAAAVKLSSLNEFIAFLGIDPLDVARNGRFPSGAIVPLKGSMLPESASGFPRGFKVVSFYADAANLLDRAYVLRRHGWRGTFQAYQRMVQQDKIDSIRRKLKSNRRVSINNIIATLPGDVRAVDSSGMTVNISNLTKVEPVTITLPLRANSIGLIDGQHRLFSYYESRDDDPRIASLRLEQNLLVTGIIYPLDIAQADAERFEAELFLSINANQTNAPTELRQEIEVFLDPFSPTAIGKQVVQRLSKTGPLMGHIENYFFDKGKLKTTTIVSYGLGPLTKLSGNDSLFSLFDHPEKELIPSGRSQAGLDAYVNFAVTHINMFLGAVKKNVDPNRWTTSAKVKDRLITVTYINSFLITLRLIIESGAVISFDSFKKNLEGIDTFEFFAYKSSQYYSMAECIFAKHFQSDSAQVGSSTLIDG